VVRGEEVRNSNALVSLSFVGTSLEKKVGVHLLSRLFASVGPLILCVCVIVVRGQDVFGTSDPFLRISRVNEDGTFVPVYRTEVIMRNLNPRWRPLSLSIQALANGDPVRPVLVECFGEEE
jgi:hypothetical protein